MTALTSNYEAKRQDGEFLSYPVVGSDEIFKGALLQIATSGDDQGYVAPLADGTNRRFVGVAVEGVDNIDGDRGDKTVRVYKKGVFQFTKATATQADVGSAAYGHDDNTIGTSSTNSVYVGRIVGLVDSSTVKLQIDSAVDASDPEA
jgi:predicted RecA/RadA family phage recombinase